MASERDMRPAVIDWLHATGHTNHVFESYFGHGYADIVGFRFGERFGRNLPPLEAVCVVELKLTKIAEVIAQADSNRVYIAASWCAMPSDFVEKMRPQTLDKFKDAGVGLLAVSSAKVEQVILPIGTLKSAGAASEPRYRKYIETQLPRKLWRRRFENQQQIKQEARP